MPTINTIEPTPNHDPDEYLEKFITLVRIHAPKYDSFSLTDVKKKMELSKDERLIFTSLTVKNKISECLVNNGFANRKGLNLTLTEKGRNIENGKEKKIDINVIDNSVKNYGDNYGVQSSEKIDLKRPIKQKIVHKTESTASKYSVIEIVSWIIGSIVGLIAIYEFVIKRFYDNG